MCVRVGGEVSTKLRRRLLLIRELGLLVADEVVVMLVVYLAVQYRDRSSTERGGCIGV